MDLSTIIGLVVGGTLMVTSMLLSGSLLMYWDFLSLIIVVGGAVCAALIRWPLQDFIKGLTTGISAIISNVEAPDKLIDEIEELCQIARKESILALEKKQIDDEFLANAIRLVVDGQDPGIIDESLSDAIDSTKDKLRCGYGVYADLGEAAPAFGMIGTVMGLVVIMANLTDPSKIGPGLAVALVTTLYGALFANLIFIPVSKKLKVRVDQQIKNLQVTRIGVAGLLAGNNPKVVRDRLEALI